MLGHGRQDMHGEAIRLRELSTVQNSTPLSMRLDTEARCTPSRRTRLG